MAFKRVPQKYASSIGEVTIGAGGKTVTFGGESVLPLYGFDDPIKNPPKIGVEVSDLGPNLELPELAKFYEGCKTAAERAKKACTMPGADFVVLWLESSDPNGADASIADCVKLSKEVAAAVTLPLVIMGSNNVEKDKDLLTKIAEALDGKNVLLMSAKEDNYKQLGVGAVQAYNQKIACESAVDLNLAKQLNVVIGQLGIKNENIVMHNGTAAVGYGFEYLVTTLDRVKITALDQKDVTLQVPIINPVSASAWGVGEASKSEADAPAGWGPAEPRGISMEVSTAAAIIAAGANAVILRHPKSVETVSKLIKAIV
jgi:acetyl-CoA decarbonylase/synthase complex subunit delta